MSYDSNVMPYGAGDERNALIDDDGVLHTSNEDTHYVYGDTPGYRRTGITDRQAAGADRMPPWANTAAKHRGPDSHGAWDAPSVHADALDATDGDA